MLSICIIVVVFFIIILLLLTCTTSTKISEFSGGKGRVKGSAQAKKRKTFLREYMGRLVP